MTRIQWLKSKWDFERLFAKGKLFKNERFLLYIIRREKKGAEIGICVGKSLGIAVRRNRLKRQIREILRDLELKDESFYAAIIARKAVVGEDFETIRKAVNRLFMKVGLL